jgi:hypothetical protein
MPQLASISRFLPPIKRYFQKVSKIIREMVFLSTAFRSSAPDVSFWHIYLDNAALVPEVVLSPSNSDNETKK